MEWLLIHRESFFIGTLLGCLIYYIIMVVIISFMRSTYNKKELRLLNRENNHFIIDYMKFQEKKDKPSRLVIKYDNDRPNNTRYRNEKLKEKLKNEKAK